MKIAYISTAEIPSNRANSIQVMKVCQALAQLGEQVHLYVPGSGEPDWSGLSRDYGVSERFPITRLPSRKAFKRLDFVWSSLAHARREGVDMVYTRQPWAAWLARRSGIHTVLEMHDLPTGRFGPGIYREYLNLKHKGLVVYITRALKQLCDEKNGRQARPNEWHIAPDGVDLERYANLPDAKTARKTLELPETTTAVYSGSFYAGRGLETLYDLAKAFPAVQFIWIGGTPEQVKQWQHSLETGKLNNVRLTGYLPNTLIPIYQAAADILLMPYNRSFAASGGGDISQVSSPLKVFEYMAAGRAILASDLPVLHEILNGGNACFYKPEDVADLSAQFTTLLADEELRSRLGAKARDDIEQYSWTSRMRKILEVVKQ